MKRIHDLEIATEKWKIVSKVLFLMEILKEEPEQVIPIRSLDQYRRQINLPKPHKISDFIQKSPKLFELYKDRKGVLWCGMTKEAEELVQEEERITEEYSEKAAEHVTRCLMMYPEHFRVVKNEDDIEFLELVSWKPSWAITELEKKVIGVSEDHQPGLLSLAFPLKFPSNYKKVYRYAGKIDHFQRRSYLSPYADAHGLTAGSLEFDKRAVAVMHELLSFTIEKRLVTDHLTHFRRELVMPQKLMRLLLKHFGIFYVSERGKRFSVFLNEAYEGSDLIEKCPLVLWKEKVQTLIGYRGRKKKIETHHDFVEMEAEDLCGSESEEDNVHMQPKQEDTICGLEDSALQMNQRWRLETFTVHTRLLKHHELAKTADQHASQTIGSGLILAGYALAMSKI
ncbi:hypothetical protein C3L33_05667, partial [Rhododendron williamsianum]